MCLDASLKPFFFGGYTFITNPCWIFKTIYKFVSMRLK